jgi:recombination protein RecT
VSDENTESVPATPGTEIAERKPLSAIIEAKLADFAKVLPTHLQPDLFVRVAQSELRRDGKAGDALRSCARKNPESLLNALLECATLGHVPGKAGGECYALTPRFGQTPGIVGIEQYQGEIQRMYRAGGVRAVHCDVVRENDFFTLPQLARGEKVPVHEFDAMATKETRGDLVGAYAFAELDTGSWSRVSWVNAEEMALHKALAGADRNGVRQFWDGTWKDQMWRKTAVHGLTVWVPTSREYLRDRIAAQQAADEIRSRPDSGFVVEGEVVT